MQIFTLALLAKWVVPVVLHVNKGGALQSVKSLWSEVRLQWRILTLMTSMKLNE